jgi:hypothetical protein
MKQKEENNNEKIQNSSATVLMHLDGAIGGWHEYGGQWNEA